MRNLIILLLFVNITSAQYNLFARQNFAYKVVSNGTNTEIGGVASTISTPALLAAKLGISVGAISNFSIVGSDIKCKITGSYAIPVSAFGVSSPCTFYKDTDGLVNYIFNSAFLNTSAGGVADFKNALTVENDVFRATSFTKFLLKNAVNISVNCFYANTASDVFYIPNCTNLGGSALYNAVFENCNATAKIYANPSLATNNAGSEDGDISYARARGCTINYVTNFTAPDQITDLSAGTIYNTAVQLNFTAPSSTNAIDYYECYANGVKKNNITASGQYITELNTNTAYNITLIAVDIFYNKSVVSNSLSVTTDNEAWDISVGLVSYYKLDETSGGVAVDNIKGSNLTNTGVAVNQSGKIGTSYAATAGSQYLNSSSYPAITTTVSFNLWVYRTGAGTGSFPQLIGTGSYPANAGMAVLITTGGDLGWIIKQDYLNFSATTNIPLNTWKMVTVTFDGSNVKTYIDAVLLRTNSKTATLGTTSLFRMYATQSNEGSFVGRIDESATYNTALTQSQIDILYNSGSGTTF